jgi:hypothetical protein
MNNNEVEPSPSRSRSPRDGTIELLQVFSLLMLPIAWLLPDGGWYRATTIGMAVILGFIPFLLIQLPGREPSVAWPRGFKTTSERLRTLEEIGIPHDILQGMESMVGVYFPKSRDLRQALFLAIGKDRVRPWLNLILRHSKYYGAPHLQAPGEERQHQLGGLRKSELFPSATSGEADQETSRGSFGAGQDKSKLDHSTPAPRLPA